MINRKHLIATFFFLCAKHTICVIYFVKINKGEMYSFKSKQNLIMKKEIYCLIYAENYLICNVLFFLELLKDWGVTSTVWCWRKTGNVLCFCVFEHLSGLNAKIKIYVFYIIFFCQRFMIIGNGKKPLRQVM